MMNIFNSVSGELMVIYGLIALVIVLIIVIVVIDRIDSKKKQKSLSDTLTLKPIMDDIDTNVKDEKTEIINMMNEEKPKKKLVNLEGIIPVPKVETKLETKVNEEVYDDSTYVESDLEKTQAQIRVEEITKALEEELEKEQEQDKFSKFEEEQEKNAIISYEQLKESFDELYEKNEKNQYLDDNQIPINIDELYELSEKNNMQNKEEPQVIERPQVVNIDTIDTNFKKSPYISPVYGIQNNKDVEVLDTEIETANSFLTNLKELRENLK